MYGNSVLLLFISGTQVVRYRGVIPTPQASNHSDTMTAT